MVIIFFMSFLPPIACAALGLLGLVRAWLSRQDVSSRLRRIQLYMACSAVGKVWTVVAPILFVIVFFLAVFSGSAVIAGVLGFAAYALLGVSMQLWPDSFFRATFIVRTQSINEFLGHADSLKYGRRGFKALGAYTEVMGLFFLVHSVFGFGW